MAPPDDLAPPPADGPRLGDAFGALLLACWERGAAPGAVVEVVERDDGFVTAADAARYFAAPDAWGRLDRWACDRARGRVLDVGAGAGRHALLLQERGHAVVALDVSPLAGEVCRRRGVRRVVTGTVHDPAAADAGPFDTFLLMGNNLGLLGDVEQAPRLLAALAALAAPGARIVGFGTDPYATANPLHHAYHRRNRARGRLGGQLRLRIRHADLATPWFDYLFATVDELRALLAGAAWRVEEVEAAEQHYVAVLRYQR
jgi:SAM-dependent methyltransferase